MTKGQGRGRGRLRKTKQLVENVVEIGTSATTIEMTVEGIRPGLASGAARTLNLSPVPNIIVEENKSTEQGQENSSDLRNEDNIAKSWANIFTGNRNAANDMTLDYIPQLLWIEL
ncbi:hypothetical protein HAX54_021798 [Datura stramonium]|uniref:Uncharacterized protein n=1 Tax=Datura stramonium TaxID=4076 RepID=A0ABS8UT90_DATST|nr:hypothetical protein [Datura stramonium]